MAPVCQTHGPSSYLSCSSTSCSISVFRDFSTSWLPFFSFWSFFTSSSSFCWNSASSVLVTLTKQNHKIQISEHLLIHVVTYISPAFGIFLEFSRGLSLPVCWYWFPASLPQGTWWPLCALDLFFHSHSPSCWSVALTLCCSFPSWWCHPGSGNKAKKKFRVKEGLSWEPKDLFEMQLSSVYQVIIVINL